MGRDLKGITAGLDAVGSQVVRNFHVKESRKTGDSLQSEQRKCLPRCRSPAALEEDHGLTRSRKAMKEASSKAPFMMDVQGPFLLRFILLV